MKKLILVILFLVLKLSLVAQIGRPFIRNYSPTEYIGDGQIWSIIQDQRGVMYFGSTAGVYEYDSKSWNTIFITESNNPVLSMDFDKAGVLYIGSISEFGFLSPNKFGSLEYISLVNELDSADRLFTGVWSTFYFNNNVYFAAEEGVYRFCNDSIPKVKKINSLVSPSMYKVNDQLFISDKNIGLMKIENDSLKQLPGKPKIFPWIMLPFGEDKFLVGTNIEGIQIYDPLSEDTTEIITKYKYFKKEDIDQTNNFIIKNQLYIGAVVLSEEKYAIGTISGGIIIINKHGKITEHISKKNNLQNQTIHYLYVDKQNELWAGLSNGISRIEVSSPVRLFDEGSGVSGAVYDVVRFKGTLYATSDLGMFYFEGSKFNNINEFTGKNSVQVFFPVVYKLSDQKEELLVTTVYGIYSVNKNIVNKICKIPPTSVYQSKYRRNNVYITNYYDLYLLKYGLKGFNKPVLIHKFNKTVTLGCEENPENIWLIANKKPIKFNLITKTEKTFFENEEIKKTEFFNCQQINNEIIFNTNKGLYKFDKKNNKFYKDLKFSEISENDLPIKQIIELSKNNFLTLSYDYSFSKIGNYNYSNSGLIIDTIPFKRGSDYQTIYNESDSIIWAVSPKLIYKFTKIHDKKYQQDISAIIRKVIVGEDSLFFAGNFFNEELDNKLCINQSKQFIPELDYKNNDINIEFSIPEFDDESSNEYSYLLQGGKIKKWSKWSRETYKEYTNLHEGTYIFKVKGRNIYGFESKVTEFKFIILPPWYRAWWAIICYLIIFTLFIVGIIRLNIRRLKIENIRLDNIVKERTAEISLQNEEIQTQANNLAEINRELSQKNEEISSIAETLKEANLKIRDKNIYITDSINYAKRIQTAVLPGEAEIKSILKDYFMIYKPKDIVGGDFYFIKKINKYTIVAVADCTGHGVPGGFLSMMGISILNEILQKTYIKKPSDALEEMRERIRSSLRQKSYLSSRTDGIDIALCVINSDNNILQYSGANMPAFIIRNDEEKTIDELKPDFQPIGIHYNEKPFSYIETKIEAGDMLYLFSDGIYDQFGGDKKRKFLIGNLIKLLHSVSHESMKIQRRKVLNKYLNWKGNNKQVDDILILGYRYSGL